MQLNTSTHIYSKRYAVRTLYVLLALAAMIVMVACSGTSGSTGSGSTPTPTTAPGGNTPAATATSSGPAMAVSITTGGSFAFSPATITIKVGTTVTWTNNTSVPHTVTSDDGSTFDSGLNTPIAANGGTFSFTFTKAGTFAYHCQIHPFMKATVVVQP